MGKLLKAVRQLSLCVLGGKDVSLRIAEMTQGRTARSASGVLLGTIGVLFLAGCHTTNLHIQGSGSVFMQDPLNDGVTRVCSKRDDRLKASEANMLPPVIEYVDGKAVIVAEHCYATSHQDLVFVADSEGLTYIPGTSTLEYYFYDWINCPYAARPGNSPAGSPPTLCYDDSSSKTITAIYCSRIKSTPGCPQPQQP